MLESSLPWKSQILLCYLLTWLHYVWKRPSLSDIPFSIGRYHLLIYCHPCPQTPTDCKLYFTNSTATDFSELPCWDSDIPSSKLHILFHCLGHAIECVKVWGSLWHFMMCYFCMVRGCQPSPKMENYSLLVVHGTYSANSQLHGIFQSV